MTRTVPAPAAVTAGGVVQSALWNNGPKAMGDFFLSPPMFRGHQNTAQAVASNTWVALNLDATDIDTDGGHSNTVNNTRYTCQVPGWYLVEGFTALVNSTGAQSLLRVELGLNSTGGTPSEVPGMDTSFVKPANDFASGYASGMLRMTTGDYLEIWTYQDSGSTINTAPNVDLRPALNMLWIHP